MRFDGTIIDLIDHSLALCPFVGQEKAQSTLNSMFPELSNVTGHLFKAIEAYGYAEFRELWDQKYKDHFQQKWYPDHNPDHN